MPSESRETIELLENIRTEIGAGMVLIPRTPEERAHNNACQRALYIIANYKMGCGLFQMTRAGRKALRDAGGTTQQKPSSENSK
jgi:hypothetical protein